jgi:hypothetical protein
MFDAALAEVKVTEVQCLILKFFVVDFVFQKKCFDECIPVLFVELDTKILAFCTKKAL